MRQVYISLTIGADLVPLVPLSMPVSCPLCRVPSRFRAARAAFHASFVPLVLLLPRSAPVSCRSCRFPRRFRAACAARAAFRAGFVPHVPRSAPTINVFIGPKRGVPQ